MSRRILMVALDALDIGLFRKALASGRIPNLAAFTASAIEAEVRSQGEKMEGSVWPTFVTGTTAGTHGHHWYMQWIAEQARFVPSSDPLLAVVPFWRDALVAGKRVTSFDLPYLTPVGHPLERTYAGWGVQDEMEETANPPSFRREILKRYGRSLTRKDTLLVSTAEDRLRLARRSRASARQRCEVLVDLVSRQDWDLLAFGFGEFHGAGHHLAMPDQLSPTVTNEQAMMAILYPIDEAWPRIVAAAGEECDIVLFGLHGMRPLAAYGSAAQQMLDHLNGKPPVPLVQPDPLRRLRDLIPASVHEAIWLRLPSKYRMARIANMWSQRMDIRQDPIFMFEGDCAVAFRLNVVGRERYGVVAPSEARAVADRFWLETRRYRTIDGQPAFGELVWTADLFRGERSHRLPDFHITYNPGVHRVEVLVRDDGFTVRNTTPESRNGVHTSQGFCFYRPAGSASLKQDTFSNEDFAPTILERLGVTPPGHLEGVSFLR